MADPTIVAGEILVKGQIIYRHTDGKGYKATSANPPLGIVKIGAAADATATLYPAGNIDCDTHSWASPGLNVYVSGTAGTLTTTAPTAGVNDPVIVGRTAGTTTMFWYGPQGAGKGVTGFYSGGTLVGHRGNLNLVAGTNVTITPVDSGDSNWAAYSISASPSVSGGPFTSVKDSPYSAVGDGSSDDTAKIQAAINAVSSAGGGVVWFPKGTYKTTTKIVGASNVSLKGAGIGVSKIFCTGNTSPHYYAVYLISKDNIEISGLSFYSVNSSSATQYGIWMQGCNNIKIHGNELYYFYNYGIAPRTSVNTNIEISNNYLHHIHSMATPNPANDGTAIVAQYLKNSKVINNYIAYCGCAQNTDHGIYTGATSDNILIQGNILFNNYGGNIQIDDYSTSYQASNIDVIGNIITNGSYFGIIAHRITGCNITNNILYMTGSTTEPAIDAYYKYNYDINISNNVVRSSTTRPLIGLSGNRITCNNNILYGNANASSVGITVGRDSGASGYVNDIKISQNSINNVGKGVDVSALARRVQITGNSIEVATTGVALASGCDYILYKNNVLVSSGVLSDAGAGHLTDTGNITW